MSGFYNSFCNWESICRSHVYCGPYCLHPFPCVFCFIWVFANICHQKRVSKKQQKLFSKRKITKFCRKVGYPLFNKFNIWYHFCVHLAPPISKGHWIGLRHCCQLAYVYVKILEFGIFGGGWHQHFWLVILVKFDIFFHNEFLTYAKYWTLRKMAIMIEVLLVCFGKNLATLLLLVVFRRALFSEDVQ